jgi:glutamate/tyrosine decarboxylase-like PLP-dependent enzyme
MGIKLIPVPVKENFEADVEAMRARISENTIAIAGSAGSYPHGVIDPFEQLSELALEYGDRPACGWLSGRVHLALDRKTGLRNSPL